MITGGNATVYVSDMDRAVDFYVNLLGLKLGQRFGNHWAQIEVGQSLVIGLHPKGSCKNNFRGGGVKRTISRAGSQISEKLSPWKSP